MKELNDIIRAYNETWLQHKRVALVTVVKVEGSSYRRPGARMLVTEDGMITGAISGGCLEGDALRKAQMAILQQKNKLEIYDTTDEEDNKLGVQLGCNGIVYILFEPINNDDENNPVNLLKQVAQHRQDAVLVTLFNPDKNLAQKGTCAFVSKTESFFRRDKLRPLEDEPERVLALKSSLVKEYEGSCTVLFQFVPPSIKLIVVGAGNDAQPMVEMAFLLGWSLRVVDGRPAYATQQPFPKAAHVSVLKSAEVASELTVDDQTAVVLMTHNYNYDLAVLKHLLTTDCRYIGVLGPKKKLHKMLADCNEKGIVSKENQSINIYGPVGLDIGAETAEEIALSVIAEIKAVFSKRQGHSLRDRLTEIHNRTLLSSNE